jgi:hypothetical protein
VPRRLDLLTVAACAAVGAGLWLLFGVLLDPVREDCNTSLRPGAYRDAMVPAHLAAVAVLSACLWWSSDRSGRIVLVTVWVYALACVLRPGLIVPPAFVAVFAAVPVGGALVLGVALHVAVSRRLRPVHAASLAWGMLVLGVPASVGYAWLGGASAFCF